jgi:hypothetical protein
MDVNVRENLMSSGHFHEVNLHLADINHMFTAPEFDLESPHWIPSSGIDYAVSQLKPTRLREPLRLTAFLPAEKVEPILVEKTRAMLRRYCQYRINAAHDELASLRWQGLKALQSGLILLAICLSLSALTGSAETLPETLRNLLSESFVIAGWVSMWHPAELLLYAWWPIWREIRIYQHIMEAELVIHPDSG